jgi:hypothetical protein
MFRKKKREKTETAVATKAEQRADRERRTGNFKEDYRLLSTLSSEKRKKKTRDQKMKRTRE